jgi:hypothetical protein
MSGRFTTLTNLSKQTGISTKFIYLFIYFNYFVLGLVVAAFLFLSASVCAGFVVAGFVVAGFSADFVAGFVVAGFSAGFVDVVFVFVFVVVVVFLCVASGDTELTELEVSFLVVSFFCGGFVLAGVVCA